MICLMEFSNSQASVLRTLIYARIFDAGVRQSELGHLLLSPELLSPRQIKLAAGQLRRLGLVQQQLGWWYLAGSPIKTDSQEKLIHSRKKLRLAKQEIAKFTWLPTVLGAAVTGSVAVGNANRDEDIDLMIVTRAGFLWLTRAAVSLILFAGGKLRTRGHNRLLTDKFCLNLWLDDDSLALPKQSLYVAREVVQMHWLLERQAISKTLITSNPWLTQYVHIRHVTPEREVFYWFQIFARLLFLPLEAICFRVQLLRMHPTRELVSAHRAFFHPRNTQGQVMKKYTALCKRYNVASLVQ